MAIPTETCEATGKLRWPSEREARDELVRSRRDRVGEATKERVRERRVTPRCPDCGGYHLTSWTKRDYRRYQRAGGDW